MYKEGTLCNTVQIHALLLRFCCNRLETGRIRLVHRVFPGTVYPVCRSRPPAAQGVHTIFSGASSLFWRSWHWAIETYTEESPVKTIRLDQESHRRFSAEIQDAACRIVFQAKAPDCSAHRAPASASLAGTEAHSRSPRKSAAFHTGKYLSWAAVPESRRGFFLKTGQGRTIAHMFSVHRSSCRSYPSAVRYKDSASKNLFQDRCALSRRVNA